MMSSTSSVDQEDRGISEILFTDTSELPLFSRIYQTLKANPKTGWIAVLLKSSYFWIFLEIAGLILYFAVGVIFYGNNQGWGIGTTMFYTVVTMSTVGYGYHHPTDDTSRLFTIFYIFVGVYFVFVLVAEHLVQVLSNTLKFLKGQIGKNDIATEYKYLNRLIHLNLATILLTLFIGAFCFMGLEGWTFIQAFYFAVETSTTVGYGDMSITNKDQTYPFLAVYIIFSTILIAFAINNLNEARIKKQQILKVSEMLMRYKDGGNFLLELDREGQGISESDFVLSVLLNLGVVDEEQDLSPWRSRFKAISGNRNFLTTQEVKALRGTDALDTKTQIKELMIRSGLSIDVMETASATTFSARPSLYMLPTQRGTAQSVDSGVQFRSTRDPAEDSAKAILMRHSEI